jgi:hypothetical protein
LKWCISDAANDVSVSYIDVVKIEAIARGPTFIAKFYLQSIPDVLVFNREGVPSDSLEYSWEILIDVDGDAETNAIDYQYFTDYRLSANHFVLIGNEVKTDPIPLGTLQALWKHFPEEQRWKKDDVATIEIDIAAKTITLAAIIVDLNPSTKITFSTFDYNPGHEQQKDKPDFIPMVPPNTACS